MKAGSSSRELTKSCSRSVASMRICMSDSYSRKNWPQHNRLPIANCRFPIGRNGFDNRQSAIGNKKMSTAVKQYHEEEAIGKTYDFQVARRLLRYLKPYVRQLIPALVLTLVLNLLGVLQPKFTEYAIDWYILPRRTDGLIFLVGIFFATHLFRFVFSYFQSILLNTVGQ